MIDTIYNEDCFVTMERIPRNSVDVVLTNPFYNTNEKAGRNSTLTNTPSKTGYTHVRYDVHIDNMTTGEYRNFTVRLFEKFDQILTANGVILYNISYGSKGGDNLIDVISDIVHKTNFSLADMIVWKKNTALPNNCSPNKLTRIWEFVLVFCRKSEFMTFQTNKRVKSYRKTGQASYESITNYIEAKNNDGACPFNKATYSTDLCKQLLTIYAPVGGCVYDPFMGTGTTAVACKELDLHYIGSEISANQVEWAKRRLASRELVT